MRKLNLCLAVGILGSAIVACGSRLSTPPHRVSVILNLRNFLLAQDSVPMATVADELTLTTRSGSKQQTYRQHINARDSMFVFDVDVTKGPVHLDGALKSNIDTLLYAGSLDIDVSGDFSAELALRPLTGILAVEADTVLVPAAGVQGVIWVGNLGIDTLSWHVSRVNPLAINIFKSIGTLSPHQSEGLGFNRNGNYPAGTLVQVEFDSRVGTRDGFVRTP